MNQELYGNINTALAFVQVLLIIRCECERSFSRLRRRFKCLRKIHHNAVEWTDTNVYSPWPLLESSHGDYVAEIIMFQFWEGTGRLCLKDNLSMAWCTGMCVLLSCDLWIDHAPRPKACRSWNPDKCYPWIRPWVNFCKNSLLNIYVLVACFFSFYSVRLVKWQFVGLLRVNWRLSVTCVLLLNVGLSRIRPFPSDLNLFLRYLFCATCCSTTKLHTPRHVPVWRCDGVTVWRCDGVTVYRCDGVTVWRCTGVTVLRCDGVPVYRCDGVTVWRCTGVTVWRCDGVTVWRCTGVTVWRCDGVPVWRCDGVTVWRCDGVPVWRCDGVTVWRCDGVTVWRCDGVPVWRCDGVTVWRCDGVTVYRCDGVTVWRCDGVPVWRCDGVTVYRCDGVTVWRCDGVTVWRCTGVTVWRCDGVTVWFLLYILQWNDREKWPALLQPSEIVIQTIRVLHVGVYVCVCVRTCLRVGVRACVRVAVWPCDAQNNFELYFENAVRTHTITHIRSNKLRDVSDTCIYCMHLSHFLSCF